MKANRSKCGLKAQLTVLHADGFVLDGSQKKIFRTMNMVLV